MICLVKPLFEIDDPFLSEANVKVFQDDPRIKIKFPPTVDKTE